MTLYILRLDRRILLKLYWQLVNSHCTYIGGLLLLFAFWWVVSLTHSLWNSFSILGVEFKVGKFNNVFPKVKCLFNFIDISILFIQRKFISMGSFFVVRKALQLNNCTIDAVLPQKHWSLKKYLPFFTFILFEPISRYMASWCLLILYPAAHVSI